MLVRKCISLTAAQKQDLCRKKQKNPLISNVELAKQYGIGKSTVTDILNEKDRWLAILDEEQENKKFQGPKWPKLENALSLWVNNALIINQDID
ncbi:818_t:CDS:1, partial [Cetraspora pellucida]